jgi:L-ascorbate metabolism protein UlaG (beta-lactamase superfamily)/pimeloyl-ACP methyl ester carboxylesterase
MTMTPNNAAPVISGLSDQSIADGERFPDFKLDDYVTDSNHSDDEITWSFAGNVELEPRIVNVKGEFSVQVPDADWTGSETILLTACDPEGLCDAVEVIFSVNDENDAPVVQMEDQAVLPGDSFTAIALDECVQDVDHAPDEIAWSFAGGEELDLDVADGVLMVSASDETWRGSETVQFQACDAGGACGSQEVTFTVLGESDLVVTYVGNEGFLIISAGKKILVDALHRSRMSPEIMALLENAQPPFDGVDLILVTHNHHDHFDPEMVGRHMANNREALFVSTYQAVADLRAEYAGWDEIGERVISVRLEPQGSLQQTINGVPLEIIELPHGDPGLQPPHNIGFLITLGEHKLLHTGDLVPAAVDLPYLQVYDLPSKQIDVLFMAHLMLLDQRYHDLLEQAFPARYLIPMHLDPARDRLNYNTISEYFPDAITFLAELASWLMPSAPDKDLSGLTEEVSFVTEDGFELAGTLFGGGETAVLFLHQGQGSVTQKSWHPFAQLVAENGFTALTFDFRGRGLSQGDRIDESRLIDDTRAAAAFLRERGYERIVCVGAAHWGGESCMRLALETDIAGLVIFSNLMRPDGPGTPVRSQDLAELTQPKLFIYGEKESDDIPGAMSEVYRLCPEPKELITYDSAARGTNLFRSPYADDLRQQLLDFLKDLTGF